ncbi:MAG: hypothetical protein U9R13_07245 [Campylobacterota bacterium]|nr:hypothetical protein [Campylobacterota bacterium]
MSLKRYQNELVVLLASLLMFGAFLYKNVQISSQAEDAAVTKQAVGDFKEIVALKKVWADKKISKKVEKLKELIPASKVKWSKKSRKVTAVYEELSSTELNKLISKILSLAVVIIQLDIEKTASTYHVEFKCKW